MLMFHLAVPEFWPHLEVKKKKKKKGLTMHLHLENSAVWLLPRNCNQKEMITQTHILKAIHLSAE